MNIINEINNLKPKLIMELKEYLSKRYKLIKLSHYTIAWKEIETDAVDFIKEYLKKNLSNCKFKTQDSKSTYPDLKITSNNKIYAIDVKCNESNKEPWFDIARLDTFIERRINKYEEEWEIVIKYDSSTGRFIDCYMCLLREAVGIGKDKGIIKYRPYDGKIRPKSWDNFEYGISHWSNKKDFVQAIEKSKIHRWKKQIKKELIPKLNKEEKKEFRNLFK